MKFKDLINGLITQKYTKIKEENEPIPYTFKVERVQDDKELCNIHFQQGPIKECGVNGVCGEDLIAMVIRRLEGFQNTDFKCKENEKAIEKFQEGLMWLRKRTNDREIAGIEGTHIVSPEINYMYLDKSTDNKSFLEVYENLKSKNIDVSYILGIYDKSLIGIDPYDSDLSVSIKNKILIECNKNIWYFLREIIIVPNYTELSFSKPFNLNLANFLIIFSMCNNLDSIIELPRNTYESTYPIECVLLYELLTTKGYDNSIISYNTDFSNFRLDIIYAMINKLPSYLGTDFISNFKKNIIKNNLNDCTVSAGYPKIIRMDKKISRNRKIFYDLNHITSSDVILKDILENSSNIEREYEKDQNNYGITILGVPSNLITDEEKYLYELEKDALKFNLSWLSLNKKQIKKIINLNKNSIFVHIKVGYKELGYSEQWFEDNCRMLNNDTATINKELLLKWNK